ncbi:MAG: RidA family protein [Candidatus Binatia bacterium]
MKKKAKREFPILAMLCVLSIPSACTSAVEEDRSPEVVGAAGTTKVAVHDSNKQDVGSISWGLKITNFSELFLVSGYGATDAEGKVQFLGDAIAQTDYILSRIEAFIEKNGYSKNDIIRIEATVTKDVPQGQLGGIFGVLSAFFSDVAVKPTGGTFRIIHALGNPDMLVELGFWLAH